MSSRRPRQSRPLWTYRITPIRREPPTDPGGSAATATGKPKARARKSRYRRTPISKPPESLDGPAIEGIDHRLDLLRSARRAENSAAVVVNVLDDVGTEVEHVVTRIGSPEVATDVMGPNAPLADVLLPAAEVFYQAVGDRPQWTIRHMTIEARCTEDVVDQLSLT